MTSERAIRKYPRLAKVLLSMFPKESPEEIAKTIIKAKIDTESLAHLIVSAAWENRHVSKRSEEASRTIDKIMGKDQPRATKPRSSNPRLSLGLGEYYRDWT